MKNTPNSFWQAKETFHSKTKLIINIIWEKAAILVKVEAVKKAKIMMMRQSD